MPRLIKGVSRATVTVTDGRGGKAEYTYTEVMGP